MTELELYKFIDYNSIEWHYTNDKKDVILFVNNYLIEAFNNLFKGSYLLEDEGIECNMKDGYFCFKMDDILAHYGIELQAIFDPEKES